MSESYPFKRPPLKHLLTCWLRQRNEAVFAYFAEMGTCKSAMLIHTSAWMYDKGDVNALVIVAPKATYRNWETELPKDMPAHVRYRVGVWTAEGRKADLESLEALKVVDDDLHVLLMNVEALGRDLDKNRAYKFLVSFLAGHRALLAVDESTVIKNGKATRTKALLKLRKYAPVRRILSGQPAVNGPLDMYSQCEFLDPSLLGFGSFYTYRAHFAKLIPMSVVTGTNADGSERRRKFDKVDSYQNLPELQSILSKFSFIVKKEDCLDLPQKLPPVMRNVEMGPKQQKAYDEMKRLSIVLLTESEVANPSQMATATLVITQMLKLHQILCGFLVTDDRKPILFDESNPRLEDLMDVLAETSDRVVIWATYKISVRQIRDRIAKEYGPESVLTFYGDSDADERAAVRVAFDPTHPQHDPEGPVRFVVSNQTGACGNTWTASHTAIYYSYTHDLHIHAQSQDRIHRQGQHWPCSYIYQRVPDSVEDKILMALVMKAEISNQITPSNWREFINGTK